MNKNILNFKSSFNAAIFTISIFMASSPLNAMNPEDTLCVERYGRPTQLKETQQEGSGTQSVLPLLESLNEKISSLRTKKPLILNLTNYVTMDLMANTLLSLGTAPLMSVDKDEFEELIKISSAININIGTLDGPFIEGSILAAKLAKQYNKPVVLDPVGAGASKIRTKAARDLIGYATIVRGNASEVMALDDDEAKALGVESLHSTDQAKDVARKIAKQYNNTVVISGEVDFVTDGKREAYLPFGSPLMTKITGMGCSLTAVVAAFRGVVEDSFEASKLATAYFGLCGSIAAQKASAPGSFRTTFIDEIYKADFEAMKKLY